MEKYFDQCLECGAPKCWSKFATNWKCFAISETTNKNLKSFSDRTNAGPSQGQSVGDSSISLHHLSQLLLFLKNHLKRNKTTLIYCISKQDSFTTCFKNLWNNPLWVLALKKKQDRFTTCFNDQWNRFIIWKVSSKELGFFNPRSQLNSTVVTSPLLFHAPASCCNRGYFRPHNHRIPDQSTDPYPQLNWEQN